VNDDRASLCGAGDRPDAGPATEQRLRRDRAPVLGLLAASHGSDGESEAVRALRQSDISLDELREILVKALPRRAESPVVTGNCRIRPTRSGQ